MIRDGIGQDIGTRKEQQDFAAFFGFSSQNTTDDAFVSEFISHGGRLAIVCDGMGGMKNGREAARCAVEVFLEEYKKKTSFESISDALMRSLQAANDRVFNMAARLGEAENCGSTLVAAVIYGESLHWISVGDSHIYLCRNGRPPERLNEEHTFGNKLQLAVIRGDISQEDADNHPDREALTSYIGAPKLEEISRGVVEGSITEGAGVVLCSDGLSKVLNPYEMEAVFDPNPIQWAAKLVNAALDKKIKHQDNVTVAIMWREEPVVTTKTRRREKVKTGKKRSTALWVAAACLLMAVSYPIGWQVGYRTKNNNVSPPTQNQNLPVSSADTKPNGE